MRPTTARAAWAAALLSAATLTAAPVCAAPPPAASAAQPPAAQSAVEARAAEARAAYTAGDHARAVELYLEAYRLAPAAALLYNVALIYDRKLTEPELAMSFYRRYIGSPDADPAAAVRATQRLQQLKRAQQARQAAAVALPEPAPAEQPPPRVITGQVVPAPRPSAGAGPLIGWTTVGVGGAALVAGGVMALVAQGTQKDFADSRDLSQKLALREDGETQALTADVLLAAGGALALTGLIVVWTTGRSADTTAGLAPTADGRGALAWIGGTTW